MNVEKTDRPARAGLGSALGGIAIVAMMAGASAPSPFYPFLQERLSLGTMGVTVAFAVYAVALLAALLIAGSLSDHIGRRPLVSGGLVLLAASVLLIWAADSGGLLMTARVLQGAASGLLLPALSATVGDFASRPQRAATVNAVAPLLGLAVGAIFAGLALEQAGSAAEPIVFGPLAAVYLLLAVAAWAVPETSARHEGWRSALRPRVAIPATARPLFLVSTPVIVAGWATGGLFLSLGASIVEHALGVASHGLQGFTIGLLPAAGAVATLAFRGTPARTVTIVGSSALAVGTALSWIALGTESLPFYLVSILIAGGGFGSVFAGVIASLAATVSSGERAELFASLYTVSYVAFGVPAVLAGTFAPLFGLTATTITFGACVVVLASVATVLRLRSRV